MTEDQRTPQNIERKIAEAIANRDLATAKGQEEEEARNEAKRKQREEENMDKIAEKAQNHSEELRELPVAMIEGYQN